MNNLLSYCGLVDAKMRASDKHLPVIGLTELPNSGWAKAHPAHPLVAALLGIYHFSNLDHHCCKECQKKIEADRSDLDRQHLRRCKKLFQWCQKLTKLK